MVDLRYLQVGHGSRHHWWQVNHRLTCCCLLHDCTPPLLSPPTLRFITYHSLIHRLCSPSCNNFCILGLGWNDGSLRLHDLFGSSYFLLTKRTIRVYKSLSFFQYLYSPRSLEHGLVFKFLPEAGVAHAQVSAIDERAFDPKICRPPYLTRCISYRLVELYN